MLSTIKKYRSLPIYILITKLQGCSATTSARRPHGYQTSVHPGIAKFHSSIIYTLKNILPLFEISSQFLKFEDRFYEWMNTCLQCIVTATEFCCVQCCEDLAKNVWIKCIPIVRSMFILKRTTNIFLSQRNRRDSSFPSHIRGYPRMKTRKKPLMLLVRFGSTAILLIRHEIEQKCK